MNRRHFGNEADSSILEKGKEEALCPAVLSEIQITLGELLEKNSGTMGSSTMTVQLPARRTRNGNHRRDGGIRNFWYTRGTQGSRKRCKWNSSCGRWEGSLEKRGKSWKEWLSSGQQFSRWRIQRWLRFWLRSLYGTIRVGLWSLRIWRLVWKNFSNTGRFKSQIWRL